MARASHRSANATLGNVGPRGQRGIALMLVMWVLALLTIMAVSLTLAQRTEMALTLNHVEEARFRAHADAAVAYTAWRFSKGSRATAEAVDAPELAAQWLPNNLPHQWQFDGATLVIRVSNESSRIDLNRADSNTLAALLRALQIPEEQVSPIADAIVDWRDEDDLKLVNGAEADDYRHAGRAFGPKNGPFVTVGELRQVLGVTPELYRRLAQEVTVDNEAGSTDTTFASAPVLAATEGISLDEALQRVAERDSPADDTTRSRITMLGGPLYRVDITESDGQGQGHRAEVLLEVTPGENPPYRVRWRRYGRGINAVPEFDPDQG